MVWTRWTGPRRRAAEGGGRRRASGARPIVFWGRHGGCRGGQLDCGSPRGSPATRCRPRRGPACGPAGGRDVHIGPRLSTDSGPLSTRQPAQTGSGGRRRRGRAVPAAFLPDDRPAGTADRSPRPLGVRCVRCVRLAGVAAIDHAGCPTVEPVPAPPPAPAARRAFCQGNGATAWLSSRARPPQPPGRRRHGFWASICHGGGLEWRHRHEGPGLASGAPPGARSESSRRRSARERRRSRGGAHRSRPTRG